MNFVKLAAISLCMFYAGFSYAEDSRLIVGVLYGTVFVHSQVIANDASNNGVTFGVSGEVPLRNHFRLAVEFNYSKYPFIKKHYDALPAVWPPTWRYGETGEESQQSSVDITLYYKAI